MGEFLTRGNDLAELEAAVERGLSGAMDGAVEAGDALARIRDSGAYRVSHDSFKAYCLGRWQLTDRHARSLITTAAVVAQLGSGATQSGSALPLPGSIRQALQLARLPVELRRLAWLHLLGGADGGAPAAEDVDALVGALLGGMTPEEQAAVFAAGVVACPAGRSREKKPLGLRTLTSWERSLLRLEGQCPELVDDIRAVEDAVRRLAGKMAGRQAG